VISRRSLVLWTLITIPVLVYGVLAGYALWETRILTRVWWVGPAFWVLAWAIAKFWNATNARVERHPVEIAAHWTPRDREAAKIVREYQQQVSEHTPAQLTDPQFYQSQVKAMGVELAAHYHPGASDPFTSLTVPEVLAAVRLAVDDTEQWLLTSVPGSRLLSIRQWQMLQSAPTWYRRFQNATWLVSMVTNPVNIARYWSSRLTADPVTTELQTEVLAVIYLRFMRQMGFYLIEMNSGRLRGGADAYRRAFPGAGARAQTQSAGSPLSAMAVQPVTVALVGQVSSGKSSLINALTGVQQAAVDILPETRNVARYQLPVGDPPVSITLLDTPGYGESGASADQMKQIRTAMLESNAVLVVMDAHSPAREADRRTIRELEDWYRSQPRFKPPPMLAVLTHIDLLRPVLEWSPPYEWREPTKEKEKSIDEAIRYVDQLFPGSFVNLIPVCADAARKRSWGIVEELIPALTAILNEAQSAALLRAFERELDQGQIKTLLKQVQRMGGGLLRAWIEERLQPAPPDKLPN
jgi:predicted GTPase